MRKLVAILLLCVASVGGAYTLRWDSQPDWPSGTTVEACVNGTCTSGITTETLDFVAAPGDIINASARAIPPVGYQCGTPLVDCPPSGWATIVQTIPSNQTAPSRVAWGQSKLASPTYIQSALSSTPTSSSVSTQSVTFSTANLTTGSFLLAYVTYGGTQSPAPTVSDSVNGAWTAGPAGWDTSNLQGIALFYFKNSAGGSKPTVTATFSAPLRDYVGIQVFEFGNADTANQPAGTAPAFNVQASPGTASNALTSNAIDLTGIDGALLIGVSLNDGDGSSMPTAGTSPITFSSVTGWTSTTPSKLEYGVLTTGSSVSVKFTAGANTSHLTGVFAIRGTSSGVSVSDPPSIFSIAQARYIPFLVQ